MIATEVRLRDMRRLLEDVREHLADKLRGQRPDDYAEIRRLGLRIERMLEKLQGAV